MKTIAVYGSSMTPPDHPDYADAVSIGAALAQAGYAVMSGGYAGLMEAASKGAAEAGGHVIGVTTPVIEAIRKRGANPWVNEQRPHQTVRERMLHLIVEPDGYIVLPGGLGTLNELVLAWELQRIGDLPPRPLICYGSFWESIIDVLRSNTYVHTTAWNIVQFAATPADLIDKLHTAL